MIRFGSSIFLCTLLLACCSCETAKKIGNGCAAVIDAATSGSPSRIINACERAADVVTDPGVQRDIEKIQDKCEENSEGGTNGSGTPNTGANVDFESSVLTLAGDSLSLGATGGDRAASVGEVAASAQDRLDQACDDCAAAQAICASYGVPLPQQMDDLSGSCCGSINQS